MVRFLFTALFVLVLFGTIGSLFNAGKASRATPTAASAPAASAPAVAAVPADPEAYLMELREAATDLRGYDFTKSIETSESIGLNVAMFQGFAEIARKKPASALTDDERKARRELLDLLSSKQKQALPILRDAFGPATRQRLWEYDAKARTIGTAFRTIEFIAAEFAANRNIKSTQEAMHQTLLWMRFTEARYRWYDGASEYTYYSMEPPADGVVGIWQGTRFTVLE